MASSSSKLQPSGKGSWTSISLFMPNSTTDAILLGRERGHLPADGRDGGATEVRSLWNDPTDLPNRRGHTMSASAYSHHASLHLFLVPWFSSPSISCSFLFRMRQGHFLWVNPLEQAILHNYGRSCPVLANFSSGCSAVKVHGHDGNTRIRLHTGRGVTPY